MNKKKMQQLEAAGWNTGSATDFLDLDPTESAYLAMKFSLGKQVRKLRTANDLTQIQLARKIRSSQSRIAKMEAGDPSVTLDLLIRTVLALGATQSQIAGYLRH